MIIMNLTNFLYTVLILIMNILLNGCAYSYIDDNGVKHIIGLVNVEITTSPDEGMYAGKIIDLRSFGVSVNKINEGGSISLGRKLPIIIST